MLPAPESCCCSQTPPSARWSAPWSPSAPPHPPPAAAGAAPRADAAAWGWSWRTAAACCGCLGQARKRRGGCRHGGRTWTAGNEGEEHREVLAGLRWTLKADKALPGQRGAHPSGACVRHRHLGASQSAPRTDPAGQPDPVCFRWEARRLKPTGPKWLLWFGRSHRPQSVRTHHERGPGVGRASRLQAPLAGIGLLHPSDSRVLRLWGFSAGAQGRGRSEYHGCMRPQAIRCCPLHARLSRRGAQATTRSTQPAASHPVPNCELSLYASRGCVCVGTGMRVRRRWSSTS